MVLHLRRILIGLFGFFGFFGIHVLATGLHKPLLLLGLVLQCRLGDDLVDLLAGQLLLLGVVHAGEEL